MYCPNCGATLRVISDGASTVYRCQFEREYFEHKEGGLLVFHGEVNPLDRQIEVVPIGETDPMQQTLAAYAANTPVAGEETTDASSVGQTA